MTLSELVQSIFKQTVTDVLDEKKARIIGDMNNQPEENTAFYQVNTNETEE